MNVKELVILNCFKEKIKRNVLNLKKAVNLSNG